MKRITLMIVVLLSVAALAQSREQKTLLETREKNARESSSILSQNDNGVVHFFKGGARGYTGGHAIAHIRRKDHKLTWLFCSGVRSEPTRRITYKYFRLCGLVVLDNNLWITYYESPRFRTNNHDVRPDEGLLRQYMEPVAERGKFKVAVYSLDTATELGQHVFKEPPTDPGFIEYLYVRRNDKWVYTWDCIGKGPLKKSGEGISCWGYTCKLKDKKIAVNKLKHK